MLDVLCGLALLAVGFYFGRWCEQRARKPPTLEVSEEEKEAAQRRRDEWKMLLDFDGRARNGGK